MKEENKEFLGSLIDTMDNIEMTMGLPMPAEFHMEQLKKQIPDWSKKLKKLYKSENNENPWE